jgi:hypothetical protein
MEMISRSIKVLNRLRLSNLYVYAVFCKVLSFIYRIPSCRIVVGRCEAVRKLFQPASGVQQKF